MAIEWDVMCGRYVRKSDKQRIAEAFRAAGGEGWNFADSYNVAPQSFQPVVRLNPKSREREIVMMRWGLVPFWSKDEKCGYSTINARAESIEKAATYREALKRRRCLVPADAFYEWQTLEVAGKKRPLKKPFAIALKSGELYGFAGVWEQWRAADGQPLLTFSIITTDANEIVAPLHDRMPVILQPKDYARWLGEDTAPEQRAPVDLLRPYPAELMAAWPVSRDVGNAKNDKPELMEEIAQASEPKSPQTSVDAQGELGW